MNENVLPLITEDQISLGSKKLDEIFDFTKIIKNKAVGTAVEIFDGKAFKYALSAFNNSVSKYVPDEYKDEIQLALNDVLDGDKDFTIAADQFFAVSCQLADKLENINAKPWVISGVKTIIEVLSTYINMMLEKIAEK